MNGGRRRALWYGLVSLLGVVLLLGTALVGYRVFTPADTVDVALKDYPEAVPSPEHRTYGLLIFAPLVVDQRLRVYASPHQVWADTPVDAKASVTPFWSLRRWPAQVVGVVAVPGPFVVTKWSDGYLVAIDGRTGREAWRSRAAAATGDTTYQGRRTGAVTVYSPPDLYTATGTGGQPVVVSVGGGRVDAFDGKTGRALWGRPLAGQLSCRIDFTGPGIFVSVSRCATPSKVDVYDVVTGTPELWSFSGADLDQVAPVGCALGRSECGGITAASGSWVIKRGGGLVTSGRLAVPDSTLAGDVVVTRLSYGRLNAFDVNTGEYLWRWPADGGRRTGAQVLAIEPDAVYVLTDLGSLVTIDTKTGNERSSYDIDSGRPWDPGHVYAADGYVFVERLRPGATPNMNDSEYYHPTPAIQFFGG
jgi:outer membrane protein assembly factor BamB